MDPSAELQAKEREIEALKQENAALLEALHLAQLGGVDLQGYLSKFNPDAAEQGIFTQDWELRYFVLSGTLLKYYTSERDVGRQYRGVLSLEECLVYVEEPTSIRGPFIFQINDPDGETLLRLSADTLPTAKTWIRTLHLEGLRVRGFKRLLAVSTPGWQPQQQQGSVAESGAGYSRSLGASLGRALSGRWSNAVLPGTGNSLDSDLSMRRDYPQLGHSHADTLQQQQPHLQEMAAAATAAAAANSSSAVSTGTVSLQRPSVGPPAGQVQRGSDTRKTLGDVLSDEEVASSDEGGEGNGLMSRFGKLRHKIRVMKYQAAHRLRRTSRHAAAAADMPLSAPGAVGARSGASTSGAVSADGGSDASRGMAAAAALAAAAPGFNGLGSTNHRRTASAPMGLQKEVSWRWERFDPGDELPIADLSDLSDDDSSSVSSTSSTTQAQPAGDAAYVHPPLDPLQQLGVLNQQQDGVFAAAAGAEAYNSQLNQHQQQQQMDLHAPLELIQEQEEDGPKRPKRLSAFGDATEAATIAAAGGVSAAVPDAASGGEDAAGAASTAAAGGGGGVHAPPTPPPVPSAGPSAVLRGSGFRPGAMGSIKPQSIGVVKPRRGPMVGYSPVHVAAKDSILTEHDRHGVLRHEGFLNLGVVVLLATNLRMIIGNLMTYGLRMRVNRTVMQSVLPLPLSTDDILTLVAIPGSCVLFAVGALLVEWLGLRLLRAQEKLLQGLQKKGLAADDVAKQGAAMSSRHERLLLLLNLLNAGGSLVLPCGLVLGSASSLIPSFVLTVVAIVMSMKLATYAHCNTSLRREARTRAVQAAAGGWAIPSTLLQPPCGSNGSGSSTPWRQRRTSRSMLAPAGLATAATHTAATAAAFGSSDVAALRSSATEPSPFVSAGLSRTSSIVRRQAAAGITNPVVYPGNLRAGDLAYFLAAPTLTYQLNFPRLRQRRWRLLSRWLLLAVMTAIAMSFMQIQFLMPCMQSSLVPLRDMNYLRFMERLLRLAVPNTAVWLAMFYLVFHLWLNIIGELLMFGDRMFYKEWWNAATLADYWKLWNIPVHKWMLRTIFFPLVRRGAPRLASLLFVFFISAVMHELAVGVPLRMLRGWAFWGMMLQVPLITVTELLRKRLKADTLGNMVFWTFFCVLGQPMCLVLYYHDWLLANLGEQGWQAVAAQGEEAAARMASGGINTTLSTVAGSLVY